MENFSPCQHREFCGGCKYNGEEYEEVLADKNSLVLSYLENNGIDTSCLLYTSDAADDL